MDEKELNKYYYLKKEIQDLEDTLKEFGYGIKSTQIKDISVSSSHINKSVQEKYMELESRLIERRISALEQYIKIEQFIGEIDDPEIRLIVESRFIKCMKWEDIGKKVNSDRTTAYRKLKKFLENI